MTRDEFIQNLENSVGIPVSDILRELLDVREQSLNEPITPAAIGPDTVVWEAGECSFHVAKLTVFDLKPHIQEAIQNYSTVVEENEKKQAFINSQAAQITRNEFEIRMLKTELSRITEANAKHILERDELKTKVGRLNSRIHFLRAGLIDCENSTDARLVLDQDNLTMDEVKP